MKPLPLDHLPVHSDWARYLLDPVGDPPEAPEAYTDVETYDGIYEQLLADYRAKPVDPASFVLRVYEKRRANPGAISVREELFLASHEELRDREHAVVHEAVSGVVVDHEAVLDLGCGYGAALGPLADAFPDTQVIGGEYSQSGVELARALHADHDRISVERFDFEGEWALLDGQASALVFTRGVVTALDSVETVVDRLAALAESGSVAGGVHLEQVAVHPETTLGLLRRQYARVRGYDGSLLDALAAHEAVEVTAVEYDVLGANPLHPLTAIRWEPV